MMVAGYVTLNVVKDRPELGVDYLALENFLMAEDEHQECLVPVYAFVRYCREKYVFQIIVQALRILGTFQLCYF